MRRSLGVHTTRYFYGGHPVSEFSNKSPSPWDIEDLKHVLDAEAVRHSNAPIMLDGVFALHRLGSTYKNENWRNEAIDRLSSDYAPGWLSSPPGSTPGTSIQYEKYDAFDVFEFAMELEMHEIAAVAFCKALLDIGTEDRRYSDLYEIARRLRLALDAQYCALGGIVKALSLRADGDRRVPKTDRQIWWDGFLKLHATQMRTPMVCSGLYDVKHPSPSELDILDHFLGAMRTSSEYYRDMPKLEPRRQVPDFLRRYVPLLRGSRG
ncbi:hypothetical protein BV25DRAFT_1835960 [Artomyces pyxidatus]|uniref:Uncharacterized protein n=1 Tax=Artomyces pyxidatus TaxID=48021 RepID=A0ACB8TCH9_9AGAM|nr:hypothetical protein BV25DRAFT_1835960 [Artomyces pyxidatus]